MTWAARAVVQVHNNKGCSMVEMVKLYKNCVEVGVSVSVGVAGNGVTLWVNAQIHTPRRYCSFPLSPLPDIAWIIYLFVLYHASYLLL